MDLRMSVPRLDKRSASRRRYVTARSVRHSLALAASLVLFSLVGPAIATVFVGSRMLASVDSLSSGLVMLDFETGTQLPFGGTATWDAGTKVDTVSAPDGSLSLAHLGDAPPGPAPTWWDTAWNARQCFVVDNPGAPTTEFPVEVQIDSSIPFAAGGIQADGSGLRAIASATGTELPLWVEGQIPSTATDIWVQLADAPTGPSEFCLYWGNAAAVTVSSQSSVFTFTTPRIRYYTLTDSYTGSGIGGQLSVVSYSDGNSVTVDGTTQIGNRGQMLTFNNVNRNSVITATAPLSGSGLGNATDSIVPESYGDFEFIFPTTRSVQTIWVRAPFGAVDLEFRHGNTVTTQTVTPAQGSVGVVVDAVGSNGVGQPGEGASVRSTNGVPFLAMNKSGNVDSILGVPFTGEPMFGMRSRDLRIGAGFATATFALQGSDGTDLPNESVTAGSTVNYYQASDIRGDGTGFRVTPISGRTAAIQQADQNSSESTAFMPYSLLDYEYFLPQDATYVSMVCPVPGQGVTLTPPGGGAPTVFPCDNPGGVVGAPGRAYTIAGGSGVIPAGTLLQSGLPFFAYSEESIYDDETNLVGALAANPLAPISIGAVAGPVEGTYLPAGTWESAVIDTGSSGSYGSLQVLGSLPAGSTAQLQIATGASAAAAAAATPVGPDGTAGTFYEIGTGAMGSIHEGSPFVRFVVTLTSTDPFASPSISEVRLVADLDEFVADRTGAVVVPISGSPGLTTHRIARFSTDTNLAYDVRVTYKGGSGLPDANVLRVRTDHPDTHVEAAAGAILAAVGNDHPYSPGDAFDLLLDEDVAAGSTVTLTVTVTFESTESVVLQKDVTFVITA